MRSKQMFFALVAMLSCFVLSANAQNVAKIGDTEYATLSEAIKAATAGQTITFIGDVNENVTVTKSVTIDGAENTFTGEMDFEAKVAIKNVNFDGKGSNGYAVETRGANSSVTIENCTAKNYGYGFLQMVRGTALTVKNLTVSDVNYGLKIDRSTQVSLENVNIDARVYAVYNSNYAAKTITIKNSKLNILGTWKRNDKTKTTYVFDGKNTVGEFKTVDGIDNFKLVDAAELTAPEGLNVTTVEGYKVVYVNGNYVSVDASAVAKIGVTGYETLSAAVEAAKAGDVITFVADITDNVGGVGGEGITKAITIDGAGHTFTGEMNFKAEVTIKNVNFDGQGFNGYAVETRNGNTSVTIENCTAKNYGYGFLQMVRGTTLTVKDLTVSDVNYGLKIDRSTKVSLENVNIDASVYAVYNSNYAAKTITIKNSKLNILGTWKRNDKTKTTYVFDGENTVGEFKTVPEIDNFKLAAAAKLTAPEGLNVTTVDGYKVVYVNGKYVSVEASLVAMIGEQGYDSFSAALENVKAGETIVLCADVEVSSSVVINKAITLDGNGKTLTYTGSDRAITVESDANGANLTVKNLTVNCTANYCQRGINYNTTGALVLEGVTVKGKNVTYALNLPGSSDNAQVTITDSNLSGNIALNVWGENSTINAVNTIFTAVDNNTAEGYAAVKLNNDGTTAAEGTVINITGGKIDVTGTAADDSEAVSNGTATGEVNISDTTVVNGNIGEVVAVIRYANGTSYSFASLAKAVEFAKAGETVTMLRSATGAGIVINKSINIDFNGKTYSFNEGVGSTGTPSNGFQILKGNTVTLKGGTLNVADEAADKFYILVQNYANLTVKDMTLDGTNLDKWSKTDGDSYVLSNNCGTVAVEGSTIIANNDGELAFAMDACDKTANGYTLPVVTVADGSTINGNVEVSATLKMNGSLTGKIVINGATGVVYGAEGLNVTTNVADHEVVYENGVYTVAEKHYVAQIGETMYEDLAEAFAAAQSDETVTLISDITFTNENAKAIDGVNGAETMVIVTGKDVTLDMNGKTIAVENYTNDNGTDLSYLMGVFYIVDGAGLTVTGNGTIDIDQDDREIAYVFWKRGTTGHLVIKNGNFNAVDLEDSMVYTNGSDIVTVEGGTFFLEKVGGHNNGFPVIFNASGNNARHINVTGGTYNTDITKQKWEYEVELGEGCEIVDNGDGTWTVIKVGAYVAESAEGAKVPYSSLAEAVAAAQDGNIVTLAADAVGEGVVINKSITIDFNGKTYTFDGGVGSTGTETLGLQIMKDNNVTLKNGTLTSTGDEVKMLIQNYANLDVVDMNLNDETDYIQYVLSSNYGKTQILGNTNITTDAVAFDSYDYTKYYPAPAVVIVKTEGTIKGAIEKSEKATIEIYSGTYTMDVDEWCADGYATVDNHDRTWTVESLYVESMVLNTDTYTNFEVQNEKTVAKLTLIRNMRYDAASGVSMVGKWTGIYLPFALPVSALGDDYEVAYFNDIHCYDKDEDGKIDDMAVEYVKIKSGTLYPNTPYAIKPKTEDAVAMDIVLDNVTLVPTGKNNNVIECSSAFVAFQFGGVYNSMTATELLENVNTTYLSPVKTPIAYLYWNGKLNTNLENPEFMAYYPFQVYMTLCAKDGSPYELDTEKLSTIGSRVVGEENDGVTTIYDVPEEMDVEGLIFDLSGRRVNETEKGIYIKDGKKVLVK